MAAKRKIDYERIEPDWRAGVKSPEQMAAEYTDATGVAVTRVAIINHFKKLGVPRDLGAKIRAKAEAMVAASIVTGKVSAERETKDKEIIEAGAKQAADVLVAHRGGARRVWTHGLSLLAELEGHSANIEALQSLGEIMRDPDEYGRDKLADLYRKVIDTPSRVDSAKKVAETLKHAIAMEREAYGLDEDKPDPAKDAAAATMPINELARRIAFTLAQGLQQKGTT